eukprot:498092-Rhodomonas_salina.2
MARADSSLSTSSAVRASSGNAGPLSNLIVVLSAALLAWTFSQKRMPPDWALVTRLGGLAYAQGALLIGIVEGEGLAAKLLSSRVGARLGQLAPALYLVHGACFQLYGGGAGDVSFWVVVMGATVGLFWVWDSFLNVEGMAVRLVKGILLAVLAAAVVASSIPDPSRKAISSSIWSWIEPPKSVVEGVRVVEKKPPVLHLEKEVTDMKLKLEVFSLFFLSPHFFLRSPRIRAVDVRALAREVGATWCE